MEPPEADKQRKEIGGLVLGAVLGALPWLLDKVKVEMPAPLVYLSLFVSVALIVWALINLGWLDRLPFCSRKVSLGTAVLLCLGVVACSAILFSLFPHKEPAEKPPLEEQLMKWAYKNGFVIQKTFEPQTKFSLNVMYPNGIAIGVSQLKDHEDYIEIGAGIAPDAKDQAIIDNMPKDKLVHFVDQMVADLLKMRVDYKFVVPFPPEYRGILVRKELPMEELSERTFLKELAEVQSGIAICHGDFRLARGNR